MNEKKLSSIIKLCPEDRYNYTVRKIADFEEVWGLQSSKGWLLLGDNGNTVLFAVWPEKECAEIYAKSQNNGHIATKIHLDEFLSHWIPKLQSDLFSLAVFPTPNGKGLIIDPDKFQIDLKCELEQYEE